MRDPGLALSCPDWGEPLAHVETEEDPAHPGDVWFPPGRHIYKCGKHGWWNVTKEYGLHKGTQVPTRMDPIRRASKPVER